MIRAVLRGLVDGPHAVMLRRFALVGAAAAAVQTGLLGVLVEWAGLGYLVAAALAIEVTIVLQYFANNAWTFRARRRVTVRGHATGLLRTNLVRATAVPIQLGVLWALVTALGVLYLAANLLAIGVSGCYRYVFDRYWTWGS
jgi:putative flippase GtrA